MHIKLIEAQQAKYTSIKMYSSSLKNKRCHMVQRDCRTKQLTLKYIRIKVSGNNIQSKRKTTATTKHRNNQYVHLLVQIIIQSEFSKLHIKYLF
jgi:hypothetical protein